MKQSEIRVGGVYIGKVSNKLVELRVDQRRERFYGGGKSRYVWDCTNLATGRQIVVSSALRFRRAVIAKVVEAPKSDRAESPLMVAYRQAKEQAPGSLLLFRIGDFYEAFNEDAQVVAETLDLRLTTRDRNQPIPMTGFPHHVLETHLRKLIAAGHRVAICEQVGDDVPRPQVKQVVR